jgi:hypothetical protein
MQAGEARALRVRDVQIQQGTAYFTIEKAKARSLNKPRTIPLLWPDVHLPFVQSYLTEQSKREIDAYLFPTPRGEYLSLRQAQNIISDYGSKPRAIRAQFIAAVDTMLTLEQMCVHLGINPPRRVARGWPFNKAAALEKSRSDRVPSPQLRQILLARDQFRCCACGTPLKIAECYLDHIDPAGPTVLSNLQVLCRPCNSWKSDHYIIDFRALWEWLESRRESGGSAVRE